MIPPQTETGSKPMNAKLQKLFQATKPHLGEKEQRAFGDFARSLIEEEKVFNEQVKRVQERIHRGARQGKGRFRL